MRKASRLARCAHSPLAWVRSRLSGPPSRRPVSTTARSASRKAVARASGSDAGGAIARPSLLAGLQLQARSPPRASAPDVRGRGPPRRRRPRPAVPGAARRGRRARGARADAPQQRAVGLEGHVGEDDPPGDLVAGQRRHGPRRRSTRVRPPRGGEAARGLIEGARVEVAGDDRPPPERGPGLGEQARPAADVERRARRAGRRSPPGTSPWWRGRRARSPRRGPAPARARPAGAAAWSGLRRYQPAIFAAGGSGQPGTASRARTGSGQAASAGPASSGAQRGAQTRPAGVPAHRLQCAERRQGGVDRRRRALDEQARGERPAPLTWPPWPHRPSAARARAARPSRRSPRWRSTSAWSAARAHARPSRRWPSRWSTRPSPRPASRGASPGAR